MKRLYTLGLRWLGVGCCVLGSLTLSHAASMDMHAMTRAAKPQPKVTNLAPVAQEVPIKDWTPDVAAGVQKMRKGTGAGLKAASDKVTIFRPVTGCRLYDSRNPAASYPSALDSVPGLKGTWFSGNKRTMPAGGVCGIPTGNVAGLSLSFHVFNWSHPTTGRIAMMPVGDTIVGNQVGFSSTPWFWTAANVKTTSNGSFDAQILDITAELIIDVNGYYQDLNDMDMDTEIDINYALTLGVAFDVNATATSGTATAIRADSSSPTGTALVGSNPAGGTGLRLGAGKFAINNSSSVNSTNRAAFIHRTSATTVCATAWSIVKHDFLNNNPNALIFITPRVEAGAVGNSFFLDSTFTVEYFVGGCNADSATTGHWYIRRVAGGMPFDYNFNVLIITQ